MTKQPRYYIGDVIGHVCAVFGIGPQIAIGSSQRHTHYKPRTAIVYLARKLTTYSYTEIAAHLNNRDHSTIIHAYQRGEQMFETDPHYRRLVDETEARIRTNRPNPLSSSMLRKSEDRRRYLQMVDRERKRMERQAARKAEREAIRAEEQVKNQRWLALAHGDKGKATRMRKLTERVNEIHSDAKPKNNFLSGETHDDGHDFMAMMARGSALLAARINEVRAA